MRRAHLKHYGMRSANTPTKGWATPYNQRALSGMTDTDPLSRMFGLDLGQGGSQRTAIIRRLVKCTENVQLEHNICIEKSIRRTLYMFYCIAANRYYFVCSEFEGRRIRQSTIYGTRCRALWLYNQDPVELTRIKWVEQDWEPSE